METGRQVRTGLISEVRGCSVSSEMGPAWHRQKALAELGWVVGRAVGALHSHFSEWLQLPGVLRLFRNMRSALGNEAAWQASRQLQRCCLSGSGFLLPCLPNSGRKCWALEVGEVLLGMSGLSALTALTLSILCLRPRSETGDGAPALWEL